MTKKILFFSFIFILFFQKVSPDNSDIYKKIDVFGEVLEKINNFKNMLFI